ncbi:MAG: non-homologous end-joining DNA ligase [Nocardioidaceae bacterium]
MTTALEWLDDELRSRLRRGRGEWHEPMLATLTTDRFSDDAWIFERKLDGVRAIVTRDSGDPPRLWSRTHKRMDVAYPELVEALAIQGADTFVADGEIVAFDGMQTSFAALQPRIHLSDPARVAASRVTVYLYLFDLLVVGGVDLTGLPLRARKKILRTAFDFADPLRFSAHRNGRGEAYLEEACAKGWEGLIAKRADGTYRSGRSRDWLKLKCVRDQELVVGGWTDPAGSRVGLGALLVGHYDGSGLRYAGKVGTGFSEATLHDLRARLGDAEVQRSPFADEVREKRAHWVRPDLVVEVGFGEWTRDGRLRHPRFLGIRTDKEATDVVREQ